MLKIKSYNYKRLPAAFLLVIYLFFSFITIAGYRTSNDSGFQQNRLTALVSCSYKSITTNKIASYKKYPPTAKKITTDALNFNLIVLLAHNRLIKVKLNYLSKNVNPALAPVLFVQKNIIPKSLEEHNFFSYTA